MVHLWNKMFRKNTRDAQKNTLGIKQRLKSSKKREPICGISRNRSAFFQKAAKF